MPDEKQEPAVQSYPPSGSAAGESQLPLQETDEPPGSPPKPPSEVVEKWDDEDASGREEPSLVVEKESVTEKDKFKLAKGILLVSAFVYGAIALVTICISPEKSADVWDFSKVALNSLVAVVVGYYFGKK